MEHVKGSDTDKVLKCLQAAHANGKSITGAEISITTGVKRSNVYVYIRRLKKWYAIEMVSKGTIRLFTYIGEHKMMEYTASCEHFRNKASHLLKATETLNLSTMSSILDIGPAECLDLMAYLVRSGQAVVREDCVVTTI